MATLVASTRFTDQAVTTVMYLPTIAATNLTPTRGEIDAGTILSGEINDLAGWTVEGQQIDTPDMANLFTSRIAGSTSAPDSDLTFYSSKNGVDVRALLPRNTTGYICFFDGGDISGNKMETYPVTVTSVGIMRSATGNEASKIKVSFSITRSPGQNLAVPA